MKHRHPHDGHAAQGIEPVEALAFGFEWRSCWRHAATIAQARLASASLTVGTQLRGWRQRRRLSQLDLAVDADLSTRHLSFVETGRAMPSREMVLRLANRLDVPLRERNGLLTAAGFAPMYAERGLGDPALGAAREAVEQI